MNQAQPAEQGPTEPASENPYLAARRTWNDHVGRVLKARSLWQVAALLNALVSIGAVGALAHVATRSKFVPYVVEVDHAGQVEAVKRAAAMAPVGGAVIEAQVERFVTLSRRVTTDIALQRAAVRDVFSMLAMGDPATAKLDAHLTERHPVKRAKDVTVTTEITSVLPQTKDTWQVDWIESVYNREGTLKARFPMRALLQAYQSRPAATSEEALKANPLSVYIRDYHWARREGREVKP